MRAMRAFVMIIAALLLVGGSALSLPGGAEAQELAQVYAGTWTGTTSQGRPIGFAVQEDSITGVSFGYDMRPQCGVSGTLWSLISEGAPLSGSTFTAASQGFGPSALSYTLTGSFSSPDAASGTLQISYVSSFPNTPCQSTKSVTWSATQAAETASYTISGAVRDLDGLPVEGARLVIFPDQAGQPPFTGQSGAGGAYSLDVPAGTYDLRATKQGYATGASREVTVPPDSAGFDLSLGVRTETFYTLGGTVRDASGAPRAGAQVTATPAQPGQGPTSAQTGADGSYVLSVPTGSYSLSAAKTGYQTSQQLSVSVPPDRTGINFTLAPAQSTVSGVVRDHLGAPIGGAQVVAFPSDPSRSTVSTQTAADGSYALALDADTYSIVVGKEGYQTGQLTVSVPPSRTDTDFTLAPVQLPPSLISGTVRDAGGAPIGGTQVTAMPSQAGQSPAVAMTAADGSYTLSVPAGSYSLNAAKAGYQAGQALSVTVPPDRTAADLVLQQQQQAVGSRVYLPVIARPAPQPVTPQPPQPPTPSTGLNGTWQGTTSQGKPITLTVRDNGVISYSFGYEDIGCGFGGTKTISFSAPQAIVNGVFSDDSSEFSPISLSYTLTANFRSNTAAEGQLELTQRTSFPYTSCSRSATVSFTASKP